MLYKKKITPPNMLSYYSHIHLISPVELNLRQKNRKEKEREEKKREKRIIEVENKLIGIYPTPNIDIESHQHFPQLQAELQLSK